MSPIPSPVSISLHASGLLGHIKAREATAAAADELNNPEAEDEATVLLHGPGVVGVLSELSGGVAGRCL